MLVLQLLLVFLFVGYHLVLNFDWSNAGVPLLVYFRRDLCFTVGASLFIIFILEFVLVFSFCWKINREFWFHAGIVLYKMIIFLCHGELEFKVPKKVRNKKSFILMKIFTHYKTIYGLAHELAVPFHQLCNSKTHNNKFK